MSKQTILFAGGGTGGHIAPLLAVMEAVKRLDPERPCAYVGLASDLESPLLLYSELEFERYAISSGKLHRFLTPDQFRQAGLLVQGVLQAEHLLTKVRPGAVFCKGSMVSVPVARAAARRGIPLFSHETDVIPGLANRLISRYAKGIFTAFPANFYHNLPRTKLIPTGQPIRQVFFEKTTIHPLVINGRTLNKDLPIVVVIGGSQGARRLNELVQAQWQQYLTQVQLVHICGHLDYEALKKAAATLAATDRENLHLTPFLAEEVPQLFHQSSVVISRAGGTIFELAASQVATILVPLSTAAQDHQRANAQVLESAGAARVVEETTATPEQLWRVVEDLLVKQDSRRLLAERLSQFAHADAAEKMAQRLLKGLE